MERKKIQETIYSQLNYAIERVSSDQVQGRRGERAHMICLALFVLKVYIQTQTTHTITFLGHSGHLLIRWLMAYIIYSRHRGRHTLFMAEVISRHCWYAATVGSLSPVCRLR